ncbi:MBL fold metallo-hydrolase [Palleronia caenipelagi]|uniref:MBL fold metallo-hydrolase n=1 Tax=Palleronia caenipelagi TaxID=2489174 RepID=A0A547Q9B1_9RHOB|nr:MBL fold metallo-hydrolase [Palleronia caenipelagi]TRD22958.1 MBL fold metallo-hydrolase [Palleronia caenipelagi]
MDALTELESGLRVIRAPNPSPMTGPGTNTYLLGQREITIIDPGPVSVPHLEAILDATRGARIARILVTHSHLDHSALVPRLAEETGVPVIAFGDSAAGRPYPALAGLGGGEGRDEQFVPDYLLSDEETLQVEGEGLTALWTPGHFGNHLAFLWNGVGFSGDLVMGWTTTLISPPDGDVAQFRSSCRRLAKWQPERLYSGHGDPIEDPAARIEWLLDHRDEREAQILAALDEEPGSAHDLSGRIYTDIPPHMLPIAARNVLAHLLDLQRRGLIIAFDTLTASTKVRLRSIFPPNPS